MPTNTSSPTTTPRGSRLRPSDWAAGALEFLGHNSLEQMSVDAIAQQLGVTKGSFYSHFDGYADLVLVAAERLSEVDQRTSWAYLDHNNGTAIERLKAAVRMSYSDLSHERSYFELLMSGDGGVHAIMRQVRERRVAVYRMLLIEAGVPTETAPTVATLLNSTFLGFVQLHARDLVHDSDSTLDAHVELVLSLVEDLLTAAQVGSACL